MNRVRSVGIRGAGLAGLALAQKLIERLPGAQITIFDTRSALPHPTRTFCFFSGGEDFGVTPTRSWSAVRFRGSGFERSVDCSSKPYTLIRGVDYFSQTIDSLTSKGVIFRWSCPAVELYPHAIAVGGRLERFDVVVDAAFAPHSVTTGLWQSFAGVVIEAVSAAFTPGEATVMDLLPSTAESPVSFMYILPLSLTEALVEHTTFSFAPRPEEEHLAECQAWLLRRGIEVRREKDRERGAIPMGLRIARRAPWPVVGTAAGAIRAGTGYGFVGIQRQVESLAAAIVARPEAARRWSWNPTPPVLRMGDALFLRALRRAPLQGEALMNGLLRRADDRDIIAFLSGESGVGQSLRVMGGVPKGAMMKALCG